MTRAQSPWILLNPRSRRFRDCGDGQMSVVAALHALNLVMRRGAVRAVVSHSFAFFTGLCEKYCGRAPSFAVLTRRHK